MDLTLTLPTASAYSNPEPKVECAPRQLLTPLPTPGHFLLVIDNSSLEVFTTCPKSADYKLVRRREAHARNAALTFGGAIHEGLEKFLNWQYYFNLPGEQEKIITGEFGTAEQDAAIVNFFTNNPAPLDEYRTVTNALAVLEAYRQRAPLPDYAWEIQSDPSGPIVERAFELPLGVVEVNAWIDMPWLSEEQHLTLSTNTEIPVQKHETLPRAAFVSHIHIAWSGRIDAVAKCNGAIRVVDHKTGMVRPEEYYISNPVLGYVWAGRQLWPELGISGFCLNALATKKPTAGCSMTSVGPRGGKPALELTRYYFEYPDEQIEQWTTNTLTIVSDFIHCLVRNAFPRHSKWCHGKYGACQYLDVCKQADPKVRTSMLMSDMFRNVTWNPVAGR